MRITKVTTKTGDQGDTKLGDGSHVSKDNARVHCLGSIDELNASMGLALVTLSEDHVADLESIQNDLLNIGGELSIPKMEKSLLQEDRVDFLEKRIKSINKQLPPLEEFIIPGGNESCARLHVARSICRRAEQNLVSLKNNEKLSQAFMGKVRPDAPLKNRLDTAQKKLQLQITKLAEIDTKLQQKNNAFFEKIVNSKKDNNETYAKVYANELAEIRKHQKTIRVFPLERLEVGYSKRLN